jgi:hypothetical protein
MVASASLSGMIFAIFSAQPVQLIGPQGPVVSFIAAIFALSSSLQVPFLTLYAATGITAHQLLSSKNEVVVFVVVFFFGTIIIIIINVATIGCIICNGNESFVSFSN